MSDGHRSAPHEPKSDHRDDDTHHRDLGCGWIDREAWYDRLDDLDLSDLWKVGIEWAHERWFDEHERWFDKGGHGRPTHPDHRGPHHDEDGPHHGGDLFDWIRHHVGLGQGDDHDGWRKHADDHDDHGDHHPWVMHDGDDLPADHPVWDHIA